MEEIKPFQTKDFTASGPYDLEFNGRPIAAVGLRFAATLTGASIATVRDDAAFRLLKTPEINQAENPLVRMQGSSWRHLSALLGGGYDSFASGVTAATPGQVVAMSTIHFDRLWPGAMVNASDKKVFLRGEFNTLASYSGTAPTAVTGKIRPFAITSERDPSQGFLRPRISELSLGIETASDDLQQVIRFEQDTVLHGFMLQVQDNSAGDQRVDGIVRAVRMDVFDKDGGQKETTRQTWGQMRHYLQFRGQYNQEDYNRSFGVGLLPTVDKRNPQWNGAKLFKAGESVTLHVDTNATVEEEYTSVTPAAGDKLIITIIGATPVAGSGDTANQITESSSGPIVEVKRAANQARIRAARRAARRQG